MAFLNRESLLKKEAFKVKRVDLGDDDYVYVRQMSGRERDRFEASLLKEVTGKKGRVTYKRSLEDFRAKLAVNTLCDHSGNSILNPQDYEVLSQNMSADRLERIVNVAQELNHISEDDKEELIKNSVNDQSEDSTSACVEN